MTEESKTSQERISRVSVFTVYYVPIITLGLFRGTSYSPMSFLCVRGQALTDVDRFPVLWILSWRRESIFIHCLQGALAPAYSSCDWSRLGDRRQCLTVRKA